MSAGALYAVTAFVLWGIFPLYFKLLHGVGAGEILAQRMAWTMLVVVAMLAVLRRWNWLRELATGGSRVWITFAASALLISVNWGTFIWSVENAHVVDASLGYFINPLVSVLLGAVVLGERLRPFQWAALALAAAGVVELGMAAGAPPWIGLILAVSFGVYGLLRKTAPLGAVEGLALETALLFPFAVGYLAWLGLHDESAWLAASSSRRALLAATGPLTAIPLLLFAAGARRITLTQLGVLQYISPTLQWLIGVAILNEPVDASRLLGFAMIWLAITAYSTEGAWQRLRIA
jgi:chloramphenicol-sensitive protein RarD